MLKLSLIGSALIAITIVIHALGTSSWVRYLAGRHVVHLPWSARRAMAILVSSAIVVVALHAIEIMVWAAAYQMILPADELATFEEAVYFSFVTFTTLGYGDITLTEGYRLLSGIEALNGIILVGWTTAMIFSVVQHVWRGLAKNTTQEKQTEQ